MLCSQSPIFVVGAYAPRSVLTSGKGRGKRSCVPSEGGSKLSCDVISRTDEKQLKSLTSFMKGVFEFGEDVVGRVRDHRALCWD